MTLNSIKLNQTVEKAKRQIRENRNLSRIEKSAWLRSVTKAEEVLRSNPYISVMDSGDVLMLSPTSNQLYVINGKCIDEKGHSCMGYQTSGLCYHRTLKRLLQLHQEDITKETPYVF
jgi:hypothetical protein